MFPQAYNGTAHPVLSPRSSFLARYTTHRSLESTTTEKCTLPDWEIVRPLPYKENRSSRELGEIIKKKALSFSSPQNFSSHCGLCRMAFTCRFASSSDRAYLFYLFILLLQTTACEVFHPKYELKIRWWKRWQNKSRVEIGSTRLKFHHLDEQS